MSFYKSKVSIAVASIILNSMLSQAETVEYYVDGTKAKLLVAVFPTSHDKRI